MYEDVFRDVLQDGERLIWSGRPAQGILFTKRDIVLVPFSILWCGFALFWEGMVLASKHVPWFFVLWGLPFILIGLFIMIGRFFADAYIRRHVRYAITDARALIVRTKPFAATTTLALGGVTQLHVTVGAGGRGTITFGPQIGLGRFNSGVWIPAFDSIPQFFQIDDARHVMDLLSGKRAADAMKATGEGRIGMMG